MWHVEVYYLISVMIRQLATLKHLKLPLQGLNVIKWELWSSCFIILNVP